MTLVLVIALVWLALVLIARAFRYRPRPAAPAAPSVQRRIRADSPHVLYYYWHAFLPGRRYIGISNEPERRHRSHATNADWFTSSTGVMEKVGWYPDRASAQAAERLAIADAIAHGEPIANTQHVPAWYRRQVAAATR